MEDWRIGRVVVFGISSRFLSRFIFEIEYPKSIYGEYLRFENHAILSTCHHYIGACLGVANVLLCSHLVEERTKLEE